MDMMSRPTGTTSAAARAPLPLILGITGHRDLRRRMARPLRPGSAPSSRISGSATRTLPWSCSRPWP